MWYPLSMASYWRRAFLRRDDIDLKTAGPYTGTFIPWGGGMNLLSKYAVSPDIVTGGFEACNKLVPFASVAFQLGDWKPDLVIAVDAMCNWVSRPGVSCPVITIGTDAHCLNQHYQHARSISDMFINMHNHYKMPGDYFLPYAFDPTVHYPVQEEKTSDCACIGMAYPHRTKLVQALRAKGISVIYENGPVFDEYRTLQNQASIGINYSSELDLNARVFELMAMGMCPVVNNVPDMGLFFTDGVDYVGFDTVEDAVYKVEMLLKTPQAIASIGRQAKDGVWEISSDGYPVHSYDQRVCDLLKMVGMNG